MNMKMNYFGNKGMTLIELVVVMVIMGILIAMSVGPFTNVMNRTATREADHALKTSLEFARNKANASGRKVYLAPAKNISGTPESVGWSDVKVENTGWVVFYDLDDDKTFSDGDKVLKKVSFEQYKNLKIIQDSGDSAVRFDSGYGASNTTFRIGVKGESSGLKPTCKKITVYGLGKISSKDIAPTCV